jgi:energy-coupling factor transporter ATP-binding protein EcfA2
MIEARHLTKGYGHTVAVDEASFVVRPGRVTGFLGPNGAGKSTTMRMILGLDAPSSGSVLIDGQPYRELTDPLRSVGRRPADFSEYRDQVIASLHRPGHAKAFSATTRTSHDPAEARLADVTAPVLVVMGEQDPDFRDPRAEADWIARALGGQVVMVPEAGHYPQSQRPGITTGAVLRFLESVQGRA